MCNIQPTDWALADLKRDVKNYVYDVKAYKADLRASEKNLAKAKKALANYTAKKTAAKRKAKKK